MLPLPKIVLAQEAVSQINSSFEFRGPSIVFLFVAFLVAANLAAKHFAQKHERAMKLGTAEKSSWSTSAKAFVAAAVLVSAWLIGRQHGGIPHLGAQEVVFIFVAFLVVANLVSKHFTMKHELALKQGKAPETPVVHKGKQEKTGMSFGMKVGILLLLSSAIPLLWILSSYNSFRQPVSITTAPSIQDVPDWEMEEAPFGRKSSLWQSTGLVGSSHASLPDLIVNWSEDLPFDADQYPSIEACAAPLARQIAEQIKASQKSNLAAEVTAEEKDPPAHSTPLLLSQSGFSDSDFADFTKALKDAFKSMKPKVFVTDEKADNTLFITFRLENLERFLDAFPDKVMRLKKGDISYSLTRKSGKPLADNSEGNSVSFEETPWLTDFSKFTSLYPKSRFYIGATRGVEPLRSKAHERAVQDAANRLHLKAEQIEPQIAGTFSQAIERPYGRVFREAILVQDPPLAMAVSASDPRDTKSYRPSFEFSLAMIVCLTVVAGFVSNIATQGYCRTGISRLVTIVALVSAILLLLIVVATVA
jgi:hypothetical protein